MRERTSNRTTLVLLTIIASCSAVWSLASRFVVPHVIERAYYGKSWQIFDRLVTGQASHPLAEYISAWNGIAWRVELGFVLLGLCLVVLIRPEFQRAFWGPEPSAYPGRFKAPEEKKERRCENRSAVDRKDESPHRFGSGPVLIFFGVVLPIAAALRLFLLGKKSFILDEMFSFRMATAPWREFWSVLLRREANMGLYYLILRFSVGFGRSEAALRSLSVLAALASLVTVYALGARAFGPRAGLFGASLLAMNGFHIEYSQDARSYSLLVLAVCLSSWFFLRALEEPTRRNWTGYIVVSALAVYIHLFAVLVLVSQGFSLLFLPRRLVPWRRFGASAVAVGFFSLPMGLFVLTRNVGQLSWVPKLTLHHIYSFSGCLAGESEYAVPGYERWALLLAFSILIFVALTKLFSSKKVVQTYHLVFLLSWFLVPIGFTCALSWYRPAFVDRYLLVSLPPVALLAGFGLEGIRRRWQQLMLIGVITGLTAAGLVSYYTSTSQDWRAATRYVLQNGKSTDAVLLYPSYVGKLHIFEYYARELTRNGDFPSTRLSVFETVPGKNYRAFLRTLPSHFHRVWFIWHGEPDNAGAVQRRRVKAILAREYRSRKTARFPGVIDILYEN